MKLNNEKLMIMEKGNTVKLVENKNERGQRKRYKKKEQLSSGFICQINLKPTLILIN